MSELLLPTDGCDGCFMTNRLSYVHPYRVIDDGSGQGIFAFYHCRKCGNSWRCGWSNDAVNLPCPGCDVHPSPYGDPYVGPNAIPWDPDKIFRDGAA